MFYAVYIYLCIPEHAFKAVPFLRKRRCLYEVLVVVGCRFFVATRRARCIQKHVVGWGQPVMLLTGVTTELQVCLFFFKDLFIYLTERAQAGGAAGRGRSRLPAEQGVRCGARSQDPGIMT